MFGVQSRDTLWGVADRDVGIDLLTPTRGDMLGPLAAISIAEFVTAKGAGIPIGWSLLSHVSEGERCSGRAWEDATVLPSHEERAEG